MLIGYAGSGSSGNPATHRADPATDNGNNLPKQVAAGKGTSLASIAKAMHVSVASLAEESVDAAVKQYDATQAALQSAGPSTPQEFTSLLQSQLSTAKAQVYSAVMQEIEARGGGQPLTAAQIKQYAAQIEQRYANDPAAAPVVDSALRTAPTNILAQQAVTQAGAAGSTSQQLAALNKAYESATPPVQQALLSQPGAVAILKAAAAQDLQPFSRAQSESYAQPQLLEGGLQNLDNTARKLDPTVAAALVSQAMPAINQFNALYAKDHGGMTIGSDVLNAGTDTVATVMDLSGYIAGTPQGDADVSDFAKIGFWDNGAVTNALYGGASAAYPLAVAKLVRAEGKDPTNMMEILQQGVEQDEKRVQADVQALGANNAQLAWLIKNAGSSMTPAQLQAAIKAYQGQGDWSKKDQQLTQQTLTDSTTLLKNMAALSNFAQSEPNLAKTLGVNTTIANVMNDPKCEYGISLVDGNNAEVFGGDENGKALLTLLTSLKLADQGRKVAQLVGSIYVRNLVTTAVNSVDFNGANPAAAAEAAIEALKTPGLSNFLGVNDNTVWNTAVNTVRDNLIKPGDSLEDQELKLQTINNELNQLKALDKTTPAGQLLRTVAVAYVLDSFINSTKSLASAKGGWNTTIDTLNTLAGAAGLVQKGANLGVGLGWVSGKNFFTRIAKDPYNGSISAFSGTVELVQGVGQLEGWFGQDQNTIDGALSIAGGYGSLLYGASQFSNSGAMSALAAATSDELPEGIAVTAGELSATLGLVGVGLAAVSTIGELAYTDISNDHANQAATMSFLEGSGAYSKAAAGALSGQDGVLSGAGGASGLPFLAKYASLEHMSTAQLQTWVDSLNSSQLHTLDQCLLQTAGDCHGNVANFTDGPEQQGFISVYSEGGGAAVITLANTVAAFQSNLTSSGVPLPPKS